MPKESKEKAISPHAKGEDKERIQAYIDQMKLDDPVSVEEFRMIARALIGARGRFVYYIWKVLKEKGLDADAMVREACYRRGVSIGEKMGSIETPSEFLKKLSTKAEVLAWEQKFTVLNDEQAAKELHHCPHMAAIMEAGATDEEMASLCENICYADRVAASHFPIHLEWMGPTIGEGGEKCIVIVTSKKKRVKT
jgi:hypothetical protein